MNEIRQQHVQTKQKYCASAIPQKVTKSENTKLFAFVIF